jgi:hypothetical protein
VLGLREKRAPDIWSADAINGKDEKIWRTASFRRLSFCEPERIHSSRRLLRDISSLRLSNRAVIMLYSQRHFYRRNQVSLAPLVFLGDKEGGQGHVGRTSWPKPERRQALEQSFRGPAGRKN